MSVKTWRYLQVSKTSEREQRFGSLSGAKREDECSGNNNINHQFLAGSVMGEQQRRQFSLPEGDLGLFLKEELENISAEEEEEGVLRREEHR